MQPKHRLNLQHLQYLEALVEERNVTRASERMGISQPAMSTALARLRDLLSDPLLVHTRRGMEPTPKALELARRSRDIGAILEGRNVVGELFQLKECATLWRVMASDGIAKALLPALMRSAGNEAPLMRFSVHPGDPRRMHESLRDGDFDLVLAFVRNPAPDLRQVALFPQRLVCVARKGHPRILGGCDLQTFLTEAHVRWGGHLIGHTTLETLVDERLEQMGHARRVSLLVASLHVLPEVAAHTDLVAVVPEQLAVAASLMLPIQVLPLPFEVPQVEVSMTWHERSHNDPAHKWLRQSLAEIGRFVRSSENPMF